MVVRFKEFVVPFLLLYKNLLCELFSMSVPRNYSNASHVPWLHILFISL